MPPFHCKSYYSSGQDQLLDPSQARYCNYKLDSQGLLLSPAAPAASPCLLSAQASLAQDESIYPIYLGLIVECCKKMEVNKHRIESRDTRLSPAGHR